MSIYETIGVAFVIYLAATGAAGHIIVLWHGRERIRERFVRSD